MLEAAIRWIDRRGLIVCVGLGVLLRCAVIWSSQHQLTQDRDAYLAIARLVASGHGYCDPGTYLPTAFRPPVYPLQLSALMIVTSEAVTVGLLNLIWGVVAIWMTGVTGRTLGLGTFAVLAAFFVAIDPMLLEYTTQPMTEATCAGLVALFLSQILRRDVPEKAWQFVAGLLFGVLVLSRPTFWPFSAILLSGWGFYRFLGGDRQRSWGQVFAIVIRFALGTTLVAGVWVIRNQAAMKSPVLMTTHGGYTLLLANNSVFYQDVVDRGWGTPWSDESFNRWQSDLQRELTRELGPSATEIERDRYQNLLARRFIASEPRRFLHSIWYRIVSLWSPMPQGGAASTGKGWLIFAVGWYYRILLLSFVLGMVVIVKGTASARWWPLFALLLTIQAVHLFYWTNARMRAPLLPVIALFAVCPYDRISRSRRRAEGCGNWE